MGGQRQDGASLPEAEVWGRVGVLSAVAGGVSREPLVVARHELGWHEQSTRAASALYAAERGGALPSRT